jgi:hypothetical protein
MNHIVNILRVLSDGIEGGIEEGSALLMTPWVPGLNPSLLSPKDDQLMHGINKDSIDCFCIGFKRSHETPDF